MEREEYMTIQNMLFHFGEVVSGINLSGFIDAIDKADTMGPVLDPTLWIKAQRQMMKIRQIAVAMRSFQEIYRIAKDIDA